MRSRVLRLVLAIAVGLAAPEIELALKCGRPDSEACVWGRAYMPVTRVLYFIAFGVATYALLTLVRRFVERRGDNDS